MFDLDVGQLTEESLCDWHRVFPVVHDPYYAGLCQLFRAHQTWLGRYVCCPTISLGTPSLDNRILFSVNAEACVELAARVCH